MSTPRVSPLVLIIRDGWGLNPNPAHDTFNAVKLANTPVARRLMAEYPWTLVKTSGEDVGIPDDTMGNSEVGHQNIGAGRIVDQESVAITKACRAGLEKNATIASAITRAQAAGRAVHLMGINSDAGVHGLLEHLFAVLRACHTLGQTKVFIHLFSDGRDTGPFTGKEFAARVESACREIGVGRVASVMGRYYAMDRDNRWERVKLAYDALTGRGPAPRRAATTAQAFQAYYDAPTNSSQAGDEFIIPTVVAADEAQAQASRIGPGDSVIFYNYRGDRPREISAAFLFPDDKWAKVKPSPDSGKSGFDRGPKLDLDYVILTEYWEELLPYCRVAFPKPPKMANIAGEYWSRLGLRQFRCAETEKYPHVTFFFNDYREQPFEGETREIVQSPKVATYDLQPEMSAAGVCGAVLRQLALPAGQRPDVIVVNFANGDMVGHTGVLAAAIKACETVDGCVGAITEATLKLGGALIVTADHGNAEQMFDPATNAPHTAHTTYDVPLIVVGAAFQGRRLRGDQNAAGWFQPEVRARRGRLADIAPTLLDMMGLPKAPEMEGSSLLL